MTDHWDPERPSVAPVAAWKPEEKPKRTWQNHKIVDRSLRVRFGIGPENKWYSLWFDFNPIVSAIAFLLILGFVIFCILEDRADDWFKEARGWITDSFTWLYVGSQDVWALVIIVIYFSKYGNMKLGKDDEEPEYNDASWFSMLFACGVGVGLIFWGVAEPILHYIGLNRYKADKYMPDNELAQHAINLTFFHWGIHGWIVYVVVGLILGFISFRKGLPMTMKSCFYPLIGDRIYGWIGDTIDIFSIITTLFGVCTSLGLGVKSISAGLNYLNEDIADDTTTQVITIWCITCVATISTASGVGMGIRRLSEICFALGMFLMTLVLLLEDTWYILNVFTQSIGFYIQWIIQLGFHCDAFAMEGPSYGGKAVEGDGAYRNADRLRAYEDGMSDGNANWMDWWTIFYWGWWISWSPFVGMFIAQISRGRTIRQFINGTMTAPCLYSIIWFSIFGGAAILEERVSASPANGLCCASWNTTITSAQIQADNLVGYQSTNFTDWLDLDFCANDKGCGDCEYSWMEAYSEGNNYTKTFGDFFSYVSARRYRYGMYNEDYTHVRLSCLSTESKWFALMGKYGGLSGFLSVVSLLSIILYFITSSDSGSLIIDILAANGIEEPPRPQRIFWALCEGATATALLVAGSGEGKDGLSALQTVSILTGLPYTIILCFLCIALWRGLAMEMGDIDPYGADFKYSVIDPFSTINPKLWVLTLKNIVIAPYTIYKSLFAMGSGNGNAIFMGIASFICWTLWIVLLIAEVSVEGSYAVAWTFYIAFATCITITRHTTRMRYNMNGNPAEDFFCALILYPCTMAQIEAAQTAAGVESLMKLPEEEAVVYQNKAAEAEDTRF